MDPNVAAQIQKLLDNMEQVVYGKHEVVKMCVIGLLARGHILIEDVPGIGKTTIAQSIARSLDCTFNGSSSPATCFRPTSLGCRCSTRRQMTLNFERDPYLQALCSRMK